MRWSYGVIVALAGAALLLSVLIRVDREAEGGGVIRQGHVVAVIPARYRAELRPAMPLRFELSPQPLAVGSVSTKILAPSEARPPHSGRAADGAERLRRFLPHHGSRLSRQSRPPRRGAPAPRHRARRRRRVDARQGGALSRPAGAGGEGPQSRGPSLPRARIG